MNILNASKNVLFVHQYLAMGDAIFLSPVYRTIKDNVAGIHISVLTNEYSLSFVRAIPDVDRVFPIEPFQSNESSRARRLMTLCVFLLKNHIDTVVLRGDPRLPQRIFRVSARICGIRMISMGSYLGEAVTADKHIVDVYYDILEKMGFEVRNRGHFHLNLSSSSFAAARTLLNRNTDRLVGIGPVSNVKVKNWTVEKTAALIKKLKGMSYEIVLFCADKDFSGKIKELVGDDDVIVVERVDFSLLMALIAHCRAYIGVDSGPLHLATAFGIPAIGLYGPTSCIVTGPYGRRGVSIQGSVPCPHYKPVSMFSPNEAMQQCYLDGKCGLPMESCLDRISVEDVLKEFGKMNSDKKGRK